MTASGGRTPNARSGPSRVLVLAKGLAGLVGGAVVGLILTLGVLVARARMQGVYFHDPRELLSWVGLPLAAGPLVGVWIGAAHPPGRSTLVWCSFGLAVGILLGAGVGALTVDDPSGRWAGMVIGGALGVLLGVWFALLRHYRRRRRHLLEGLDPHPPRSMLASLFATALLLGPLILMVARVGDPVAPGEPYLEPEPDPADVESVILLLGDAGNARQSTYPILPKVREEVSRWSGILPRDSAVVVLLLGDIVYPRGVGGPGSVGWSEDSARVADQASLVADSVARARGARGFFLAGNHDWGQRQDLSGAERVAHLGDLLDSLRAHGPSVILAPPAGTGGPVFLDVGDHLRIVMMDTAWWLLQSEPGAHEAVLEGVSSALASAGDRSILMAAHHPYDSGGPHGGLAAVGRGLGIRTLLSLSGALLQDLRSQPYVAFRAGLREAFAEHGRPALFAGGHEHSMQLVRGVDPSGPLVSLVSGAASNLTAVGMTPGIAFARSEPGFARLLVLADGTLHLSLETAPAEYLSCPDTEPERVRCMADGVAAYRLVWSERLRVPSP